VAFKAKSSMLRHRRNTHALRKYKCEICQKEFNIESYLIQHMLWIHNELISSGVKQTSEKCAESAAKQNRTASSRKRMKVERKSHVMPETSATAVDLESPFVSSVVHDETENANDAILVTSESVRPWPIRHRTPRPDPDEL